uniref:Uncharacterized protein n=1 Tax=uncultured marine bacterium Ant4D5 TaxID=360428 RepID=Q2PY03_9BACT|nr:hypothetical protein [uncultured marine bacterium Ant4D5]
MWCQNLIEAWAQPSDPDREPSPVGGDGSTGATGRVSEIGGGGGYDDFFIDAGDPVLVCNGQFRNSLIVDPTNGRRPAFTEERQHRAVADREFRRWLGAYDNPESRPLDERCIIESGSNAGPALNFRSASKYSISSLNFSFP